MTRQPDDFEDLRDAMDLWREDVARKAHDIDAEGALADRVLAAVHEDRPMVAVTGARWYAAAAVLLIAVGVSGTWMSLSSLENRPTATPRVAGFDRELLEALVTDPQNAPRLAVDK